MKHISSFFANTAHFVRTMTMMRFAVLLGAILNTVAIVSLATGGTWVAAVTGITGIASLMWYCALAEDTIKTCGRMQWW